MKVDVIFILLSIHVSLSSAFPKSRTLKSHDRLKRNVIACPPDTNLQSSGVRVFLTVSSLAKVSIDGKIIERQLELNWFNDVVQEGDFVGLYSHDPTVNPLDPLQRVMALDHPSGYFRTLIQYPRPDLRKTSLERQCLGYWIGYVRSGSTVAMDCLKIQPNWMFDMRNDIGHLSLKELMIPGTHDSGSYAQYVGNSSENIFVRWIIAQDEPFWEQLVYGIRAFDIRMGYYSETEEVFWLNHNFVKVNAFRDAIQDLKTFLNRTMEVVLLDFHRFPVGFTNKRGQERHIELLEYMTEELGEYMLVRDARYDISLNSIWRSGKRLIVCYSDPFFSNDALLWAGISQKWANTMKIADLFVYLQSQMSEQQQDFWSAMAELTPSALEIIISNESLRIYADEVNRNVTHWFRDLWWNDANIVSVDFFLGNNIVDVSIESNLKRKMCRDRWLMAAAQRANAREQFPFGEPPAYVGPRTIS